MLRIAVLLVMKRAHSTSPKAHQKGERGGSSILCFSFVGFFIFVPSFFVCGCMHGPPVVARSHLTNRRGHTHRGGHGSISSSFSWLSSCPAPKSAHQKVQKSSFMTPCCMQRQNKTTMYIRQPVFLPSPMVSKLLLSCFVFIFYFLTLINLHTMCVSLVNLLKLPGLSDQLICDVLFVWVCHALALPSVHSGPCAHKAMTVSCP